MSCYHVINCVYKERMCAREFSFELILDLGLV